MDFSKYKLSGQTVNLAKFPTIDDGGVKPKSLKKIRNRLYDEIAELQEVLCAESKQSLLIVLQAMDAAGKDSSIEKLTRNFNAQGCQVHSFKSPTKKELKHDFLWRIHATAPQAGDIAIFNRSHYEDVLIVKVHGWASESEIDKRYQHINNFESLLNDNGTRVLKFMLNISTSYQLERFKNRLERTEKNWKFNPGDLEERKCWSEYMAAFEVAMTRCSSDSAPWYVVPAENRLFRDVMIATVVRDTLLDMQCEYPKPDFDVAKYSSDSLS